MELQSTHADGPFNEMNFVNIFSIPKVVLKFTKTFAITYPRFVAPHSVIAWSITDMTFTPMFTIFPCISLFVYIHVKLSSIHCLNRSNLQPSLPIFRWHEESCCIPLGTRNMWHLSHCQCNENKAVKPASAYKQECCNHIAQISCICWASNLHLGNGSQVETITKPTPLQPLSHLGEDLLAQSQNIHLYITITMEVKLSWN